MNWRSTRFLLFLLLSFLVLIVGVSLTILYVRIHASITIVWQALPSSLHSKISKIFKLP
jgi:hypothetical protein